MKKIIILFLCTLFVSNSYADNTKRSEGGDSDRIEVVREPEVDGSGHIAQKTIHRLNDQVILISPFSTNPNKIGNMPTAGSTTATTPIVYHNGPVMTQVSAIYIIWYGNWKQSNGSDTSAGQQLIRDAIYGLSIGGPLSHSGVTTGANSALGSYTQSAALTPPGGKVSSIASSNISEYTDSYSQGLPKAGTASLSDAGVTAVVKNAMTKSGWIPDANAIYLVLTSSDVSETSGFCSKYCGWHTYTTSLNVAKTPVKYAFIGNANRCIASCAPQSTSPNSNPGVDGMISVIAHELEETVTDPQLNAWYDKNGAENADKCAWTFGSSTGNMKSSVGPYYNVTLPIKSGGNKNYLIQRSLAVANSKCYVDASGNQ